MTLSETLKKTWDFIRITTMSMDLIDVLDILVVALLLYAVYRFIRDRRAGKLAIGVVVMILARTLSDLCGLNTLHFLMENVFQIGLLAIVIVFQPELRSALEKIGSEPLRGIKSITEGKEAVASAAAVREISEAVSDMSASKTGALIVIERSTKLGDVIGSGVTVNADISSHLIKNIFFNKSPLHDGAMVIRDGRICAAGCFLPLSQNEEIIQDLGTRHRAGIGISEVSDAVVVIVSEETGSVSVARGGELTRGYDYNSIMSLLSSLRGEPILRKKNDKGDGRKEENA